MKLTRNVLLFTLILLPALCACVSTDVQTIPQEPTLEPTAEPAPQKVIRLYFSNANGDLCYADTHYIEVSVPEAQYNAETAIQLLLTHTFTEEELAAGFYYDLDWLNFGSLETVIDEDGSLAGSSQQTEIGKEYLRLRLVDDTFAFVMGEETAEYINWANESKSATGMEVEGGFCWLQEIASQIDATLRQFLPTYVSTVQYWHDGSSPYIDLYYADTGSVQ